MKKPVFAALLALLYCVSGAAQNMNQWHTPKGLPSGNEIGVRYSAQLFMGDGRGPEFEAISIDYARYNYYNVKDLMRYCPENVVDQVMEHQDALLRRLGTDYLSVIAFMPYEEDGGVRYA